MSTRTKYLLGISLLLAIGTFAAFRPVTSCQFVNFDDPRYLDIPHVQSGLSTPNIGWALTATHASNWHPLTWMSLMLDRSLYGDHPAGYHVTSLLFHIGSTILLFLLLSRITGSLWRSGFVAALFGIHPLHVESVAWVAERKDVLSAFFMMVTLWAYVLYTERPTFKRRLASVMVFVLGLAAKPMLVTLPFVLLLLDYWPLGRFKARKKNQATMVFPLIREKLPFFMLAGASCVITYLIQHNSGAAASLERIPLWLRVENGLLAYAGYLWKTIWPARLAYFYPYPTHLPAPWKVAGALFLLGCLSILVIRQRRNRPYLLAGWLWFLGTLVPVIGLVQVGNQAMADRYTYVPLIGLFMAIAWGVADIAWARKALPALAAMVILGLAVMTWRQANTWHGSISLSRHAIEVTQGNYEAYCMLGIALTDQGKPKEAVEQFQEAVRIKPKSAYIHTGLANALAKEEKFDAAVSQYEEAIRLDPSYPLPHYNLGIILAAQGRLDEAINHLSKAAEINRGPGAQPEIFSPADKAEETSAGPNDAKNHLARAMALARAGRLDEAIVHLREARKLTKAKPDDAEAHFYLGNELSNAGNKPGAILEYREAIRLKPDFAAAHNNLAVALYMAGDYTQAWKEARLCERYGLQPPADFLKALSEKQPEP